MREDGPAFFFRATSRAFGDMIVARRGQAALVGGLCAQAFDLFEKNVANQTEGAPAIACQGECAACCRLRVVATAPEIFLLARFVSHNAAAFEAQGIMLSRRIGEAARSVGGLGELDRMAERRDCSFIEKGLCLAYRLRPLACRGHAAFDRQACVSAAEGGGEDAAISEPHLVVRSLVQNALMNALREAKLAWGLYEVTLALDLTLKAPRTIEAWLQGDDPLAPALLPDFSYEEAAALFDAVAPG
ncbi:YkgJ family cysteine cluster protein [Methylocystis sp. S23]